MDQWVKSHYSEGSVRYLVHYGNKMHSCVLLCEDARRWSIQIIWVVVGIVIVNFTKGVGFLIISPLVFNRKIGCQMCVVFLNIVKKPQRWEKCTAGTHRSHLVNIGVHSHPRILGLKQSLFLLFEYMLHYFVPERTQRQKFNPGPSWHSLFWLASLSEKRDSFQSTAAGWKKTLLCPREHNAGVCTRTRAVTLCPRLP